MITTMIVPNKYPCYSGITHQSPPLNPSYSWSS